MKLFQNLALATLALASLSNADRIVVYGDEWPFTDGANYGYGGSGFSAPNDGGRFALNVADWLTEGTGGANILISSTLFALTGNQLNTTLVGAGYSLTYNSGNLSAAALAAYDAVFLEVTSDLTSATLTQYVNNGGNVLMLGGTGGCESCAYDPFLNAFGLDFGAGYNGIGSPYSFGAMSLPVSGTHPILAGIDHLQYGNGSNVYDIQSLDPRSAIIASYAGVGVLGVYDGNPAPAAVPEPGTVVLMGLGLGALAFAARRRRQG